MAVENMRSAKVRVYLNAGSNPATGGMIVKNTLLGYVTGAAEADKILTVANALFPCLAHPAVRVERMVASSIEP